MKNSFIVTLSIMGLMWITPAWALFEADKGELLKGANITLVEAVEQALTNVKGKAVGVELEKEDEKTVFEVEVVDEAGVSQEVYVDANTGNVLKIEKE
jgi:uncharacterized membrane protein YkoI